MLEPVRKAALDEARGLVAKESVLADVASLSYADMSSEEKGEYPYVGVFSAGVGN